MSIHLTPQEVEYMRQHVNESRQGSLVSSLAVCTVLAVIATFLRFVARRLNRAKIQADDYWCLVSLGILIAQAVFDILMIQTGVGRHVILLKGSVSRYIKLSITAETLYVIGTATIKYCVLCLYYRLFQVQRYIRITVWALIVFVTLYSVAGVAIVVFRCRPVNAAWNLEVHGQCLNLPVGAIVIGAINVATDFAILALPVHAVWKLQMALRWKIQIVGIFLLGGFVCIGSIYRTTTLYGLQSVDATWDNIDAGTWAYVENAVGIVSACLPVLRPIYSVLKRRHHCNAGKGCERCQTGPWRGGQKMELKRIPKALDSTRSFFRRFEKPLPPPPSVSDSQLCSSHAWSSDQSTCV